MRVLAWVAGAAVVAFTALPILYMVLLSFDPDPVGAAAWPPRISGVNYATLADPIFGFYPALVRSLVVAVGTTLASLVITVPGAYALARLNVPGASRLLAGMLALAFFPGVILLVTLSRLFSAIGLFDQLAGISVAQLSFAVPLALWFITYAFRQVPPELEEAARLDGAGTRTVILRVFLPVARPGLAAATALVFLASWSDFLFSSGLSVTKRSETLTVLLSKLPTLGFLGGQMAAGVLMCIPVAAVVAALLAWLERRTRANS
jgi:multiple sugar transport system permease protein